jgi:micrococcal nuclease
MYEYRAWVVSVHDGDTVTVDLDLGCHVWLKGERIRLLGINAPEITGETKYSGLASRDALAAVVLGKMVELETVRDKREKYGRYLGILRAEIDGQVRSVNDWLVEQGHAARS